MSDTNRQNLELHFDTAILYNNDVTAYHSHQQLKGNQVSHSSTVTMIPSSVSRWDYHSEAALYAPMGIKHQGICIKSTQRGKGALEFVLHGLEWESMPNQGIETFGMLGPESLYWFSKLSGLIHGVAIPELSIDDEIRSFTYSVPLRGLTAKGELHSFLITISLLALGTTKQSSAHCSLFLAWPNRKQSGRMTCQK